MLQIATIGAVVYKRGSKQNVGKRDGILDPPTSSAETRKAHTIRIDIYARREGAYRALISSDVQYGLLRRVRDSFDFLLFELQHGDAAVRKHLRAKNGQSWSQARPFRAVTIERKLAKRHITPALNH